MVLLNPLTEEQANYIKEILEKKKRYRTKLIQLKDKKFVELLYDGHRSYIGMPKDIAKKIALVRRRLGYIARISSLGEGNGYAVFVSLLPITSHGARKGLRRKFNVSKIKKLMKKGLIAPASVSTKKGPIGKDIDVKMPTPTMIGRTIGRSYKNLIGGAKAFLGESEAEKIKKILEKKKEKEDRIKVKIKRVSKKKSESKEEGTKEKGSAKRKRKQSNKMAKSKGKQEATEVVISTKSSQTSKKSKPKVKGLSSVVKDLRVV